MQTLGSHTRPIISETLGIGPVMGLLSNHLDDCEGYECLRNTVVGTEIDFHFSNQFPGDG